MIGLGCSPYADTVAFYDRMLSTRGFRSMSMIFVVRPPIVTSTVAPGASAAPTYRGFQPSKWATMKCAKRARAAAGSTRRV